MEHLDFVMRLPKKIIIWRVFIGFCVTIAPWAFLVSLLVLGSVPIPMIRLIPMIFGPILMGFHWILHLRFMIAFFILVSICSIIAVLYWKMSVSGDEIYVSVGLSNILDIEELER